MDDELFQEAIRAKQSPQEVLDNDSATLANAADCVTQRRDESAKAKERKGAVDSDLNVSGGRLKLELNVIRA